MKRWSTRLTFLILTLLLTCGSAFGVYWNHDPMSDIGPFFWGTLENPDGSIAFPVCSTGKQQSPVDIAPPIRSAFPLFQPLVFKYAESPLTVLNNGHAIEVEYEAGSFLTIGRDVYQLAQFHFHAPSEHTFHGAFYDMEAHLVHKNAAGQLAVVGIWMKACYDLDPTCKPNELVDLVFDNAPAACPAPPCANRTGISINATELLPKSFVPFVNNNYYTYPGSLTTPPCTEGVRWSVLKDPVIVRWSTVEKFHDIISNFPTYFGFPNDNRPTQPLNGRVIQERFGR